MSQKGTMVKKAKTLRGDAVRWLDKRLKGKTFSKRYDDARELLRKASAARSKLEYEFPKPGMAMRGKLDKEREKLYAEYKAAVAELTADVEDAIRQMTKLRGAFLASENASQREQYDAQLKQMKQRLDDFRNYAKWVPADLRRREYREADAAIAAALSPKSVPRKAAAPSKAEKALRKVNKEMRELKSKKAAAKSEAKKATLAREINKLRAKRDRLKAKLEAPAGTAVAAAPKEKEKAEMDFTKFASRAERRKFFAEQEAALKGKGTAVAKKVPMPKMKEAEMAFTEADVERFKKKGKRAEQKQKKEMLASLQEARSLTREMAARKKAGKSIAGVRRKRYEAFARYVELGGDVERVPANILKAMIKEGRKMV